MASVVLGHGATCIGRAHPVLGHDTTIRFLAARPAKAHHRTRLSLRTLRGNLYGHESA